MIRETKLLEILFAFDVFENRLMRVSLKEEDLSLRSHCDSRKWIEFYNMNTIKFCIFVIIRDFFINDGFKRENCRLLRNGLNEYKVLKMFVFYQLFIGV